MRRITVSTSVLTMALLAITARAESPTEARGIIDKGIQAAGGEAALSKIKAGTIKMKGKFYGLGAALDYVSESSVQYPSQLAQIVESEANGMKFTFTQILNGDKGWIKLNDSTMDMDADQLTEAR